MIHSWLRKLFHPNMVMCYENDYSNLEKPRRQTSYTYGNYVDSNKLNISHNDFHAKS